MRIGCLQFAPQVGKVNDNLNRADAVLNRSEPDGLDLLVLPELAFSGYNYKSLADIVPFLEHSGSGISSLWARTIALKYECTVVVGYPEKVDVSLNWPTSPEYYNAAIVVNGDGETVGNYRKTHLFMTDEKWALENPQGFYKGFLAGLGRTAIGICMDLNPYRFEAPWDAFEFAFHVIKMQANLVILSMAWMTREDGRTFSRMPQEPDMETLAYWVTRLEPIIRAEDDREVIVVFANRTGVEDDVVYAGTSAVLGIKNGEVRVYGMLGRGDKELLVVDTNHPPYARLVQNSDGHTMGVSSSTTSSRKPQQQRSRRDDEYRNGQTGTKETPHERPGRTPDADIKSKERRTLSTEGRKQALRHDKPSSSHQTTWPTNHHHHGHGSHDSGVATPTCPSPTPRERRPRLTNPSQSMQFENQTTSNMTGTSDVSKMISARHRSSSRSRPSKRNGSSPSQHRTIGEVDLAQNRVRIDSDEVTFPDRPSSPKSRNASRSRGPERPGSAVQPNAQLDAISQQLTQIAQRVSSAQGRQSTSESHRSVSDTKGGREDVQDRYNREARARANSGSLPRPASNPLRGRNLDRPSSRVANHSQSPHHEEVRTVSRGRQPRPNTASSTPNRSGNRRTRGGSRASNSAGPVDLSQFRLIEEFTAPDCPLHGSRSQSASQSHDPSLPTRRTTRSREPSGGPSVVRATSRSAMHRPSRSITTDLPQGQSPVPRAQTSIPTYSKSDANRGTHTSQSHVPNLSLSREASSSGNPSPKTPFEPQTPKAMTLVYDMEADMGEDVVITCIEKVQGLEISRPRSVVW